MADDQRESAPPPITRPGAEAKPAEASGGGDSEWAREATIEALKKAILLEYTELQAVLEAWRRERGR